MKQKTLLLFIVMGVVFGICFEKSCKNFLPQKRTVVIQNVDTPQPPQEKPEIKTSKTIAILGPKHLRQSLYFLTLEQRKEMERILKKHNLSASSNHKLFFSIRNKDNHIIVDELHYYGKEYCIKFKINSLGELSAAKARIKPEVYCVSGTIGHSFYQSASQVGLPSSLVGLCIKSTKQGAVPLKSGSPFKVVYDVIKMPNGYETMHQLKYFELQSKGKTHKFYYVREHNMFFNEKGMAYQKQAFVKPLKIRHVRISSNFGWRVHPITGRKHFHQGLDFNVPRGTYIIPAAPGRVRSAGWRGGYGRCVDVVHSNGFVTRYAHMHTILVKPGMHVNPSMSLGTVGNSGVTTGVHLHFEVHQHGKPINPKQQIYMPQQKLTGKDYRSFCDLKLLVKRSLINHHSPVRAA